MAVLGGNPGAAVQYGGANQSGSYALKPDAYYDRLLLKMLRQLEFHYSKYAIEKSLPKNFGDTINWRRFNKLAVTKNALIEGETPAGQKVSGESITAVIAQYGNVMYFTDIVELQQLDKIKQEYTVELGFQAKESLDEIVRDALMAEGSVFFPGGVGTSALLDARADNNADDAIPTIDDFRRIVLSMKKDFIGGNRKAGGRYVALVSPEVMAQLFEDTRVQNFMDYGKTNAMFTTGMVVDMFGIRFEEVLNAPIFEEGGHSMHISTVIGEEAYAITKLEGAGLKVISKGLGSAGVEDPLDQRQSIGWKITGFGVKVLESKALINYISIPKFEDPTLRVAGNADLDHTITFEPSTVTGQLVYQIGRKSVTLRKGSGYQYKDWIALAGISAPGVITFHSAAAADANNQLTLTDTPTVGTVYVKVVAAS
jgi:N4-gp56 family major capsid protein